MHAIAITPVGPLGAFVARLPQQRRPSPSSRRVGSHINLFEACSAFTARYGLHARQVPCRTLYTGSFNRFVTSTTVPIATGWNDSCRVGIAPTEKSRLPRRTGASDLFVNVHLGSQIHSFIVANLGNRTTITRDLRLVRAVRGFGGLIFTFADGPLASMGAGFTPRPFPRCQNGGSSRGSGIWSLHRAGSCRSA